LQVLNKYRKDKTIDENEGALSSRKQIWLKCESEAVIVIEVNCGCCEISQHDKDMSTKEYN